MSSSIFIDGDPLDGIWVDDSKTDRWRSQLHEHQEPRVWTGQDLISTFRLPWFPFSPEETFYVGKDECPMREEYIVPRRISTLNGREVDFFSLDCELFFAATGLSTGWRVDDGSVHPAHTVLCPICEADITGSEIWGRLPSYCADGWEIVSELGFPPVYERSLGKPKWNMQVHAEVEQFDQYIPQIGPPEDETPALFVGPCIEPASVRKEREARAKQLKASKEIVEASIIFDSNVLRGLTSYGPTVFVGTSPATQQQPVQDDDGDAPQGRAAKRAAKRGKKPVDAKTRRGWRKNGGT